MAAPLGVANDRARRRVATRDAIRSLWMMSAVLCIASWSIAGCHASSHPKPSGTTVGGMEAGVEPGPQAPRTAEAICDQIEAAWKVLDEALREVERNVDNPARASENLAAFVREHAAEARARARRVARALATAPARLRERVRGCTRRAMRGVHLDVRAAALARVAAARPDLLDELLGLLPPEPGEDDAPSW